MAANALAVLVYLAVATSVVLLIVRLSNARGGPGGPLHDLPEAAFVQGGPARVVDSVLATMHADGLIGIGGPGIVVPLGPGPRHPVEQAVLAELAAAPHGALHTLRLAVMRHPSVQEIGNRLAARRLLVAPAERRRVVRWAMIQGFGSFVMIFVSLLVTFIVLDTGTDAPLPFIVKVIPALGIGIVSALICGAIAAGRVTAAGHRALLSYRQQFPYRTDAGYLVALRGLGALPDPDLQAQLITAARMPRTPAHRGSSSDDAAYAATVWCAGISGGGGGCGGGGGDGGSACSSGSTCSSSSSSCSSSSSSSSCSSSSGSSCGSSS
ncbi:TIGR04222 domain-containing membrane protein [Streptomyces sp. HUAS MG47]|uniref:TIGR04222 domain-containing membrane protein n=1 Tax=Streptomyces solicamelliae TaxID=3231716 RepID=UPI003877FA79